MNCNILKEKKTTQIAQNLGYDVKWVSEKIYRLKRKYGEYMQSIVKETLSQGENLEEEIAEILSHL